jgi:glutaredoxin
MKNFVLVIALALLTAAACNNTVIKKEKKIIEVPTVQLYSADWCMWCAKAEKFLKDNKIKYILYDIETQKGYDKLVSEATRINYSGELGAIPTFIVGNKMIIGYDPIEVLYTLKRIEIEQTCTTGKLPWNRNFSTINITKIQD